MQEKTLNYPIKCLLKTFNCFPYFCRFKKENLFETPVTFYIGYYLVTGM